MRGHWLFGIRCVVKKRGVERSGDNFGGSEERGVMRKATNARTQIRVNLGQYLVSQGLYCVIDR